MNLCVYTVQAPPTHPHLSRETTEETKQELTESEGKVLVKEIL